VQDILAGQTDAVAAADEAPSLVQAVWRVRAVVLACVLIGILAGMSLSQVQTSQYTAQTRVFLSAQADFDPLNQNQNADPTRFVADQVAQLDSSPVLAATATTLGLPLTAADLSRRIRLSDDTDSDVITLSATAGDPAQAKQIADTIVESYRTFVRAQVTAEADAAVAATRTTIGVQQIRQAAAVYGDGVGGVEPADTPTARSSPATMRNGLIAGLIGLLIGTGYALWRQSSSHRRIGSAEAAALFGAPVLTEIPDRGRIGAGDAIAPADSGPGDAYRMAAVGLDYIRGAAPGVFLVTGPHDGAGASLTALNLAAAAADHGRRVFLLGIEDTVRPESETDAGVQRVPLHDLAQGRVDLGQAVERRAASRASFGIIRVKVLHPVRGHPVADVQQILDQLPDDTDLVLLDAPPLPASSASFVLAGQVDAAVVVVDERTSPADLEELQRRTRLAGIPVAGVLMNHIRPSARRRPAPPTIQGRSYDTAPRGLPVVTLPRDGEDELEPAAYGVPPRNAFGRQEPTWTPGTAVHDPNRRPPTPTP
jgi:capsular polysaccharide biosynthesis protein/Mrp family chromosome partitioning ATPase